MSNRLKKKKLLCGIIMMVLLTAGLSPCAAQENDGTHVIEVLASSPIYEGNMSAARHAAISNGLVYAVGQAALNLLPVSSQIDRFQQVNETLYEQIDAYVQDYKVLTEYMSDKNYRALVQVTVMQEKMKEDLLAAGLLSVEKRRPKILFFISEENVDEALPIYWWGDDLVFAVPASEEAIGQVLKEKQFDIIRHGDLTDPLNYELQLSVQDAVTIGVHRGADIVVIGSAKAEKTTNVMGGNVKSFKASVTVRAYRTDTSEVMAFSDRTAVFASDSEKEGGKRALYEAGSLAGSDMALQLSSAWSKQPTGPKQVKIVVQGTSELINFVKFRRMLGKIEGVTAIHLVEIKADESTILVDYEGTAQSLADALMLNTFDSFGIDIYEVLPQKLGIELIPG